MSKLVNVLAGINVLVGRLSQKYSLVIPILLVQVFEFLPKIEIIAQNNKRTGWNKSVLVGKILKK